MLRYENGLKFDAIGSTLFSYSLGHRSPCDETCLKHKSDTGVLCKGGLNGLKSNRILSESCSVNRAKNKSE